MPDTYIQTFEHISLSPATLAARHVSREDDELLESKLRRGPLLFSTATISVPLSLSVSVSTFARGYSHCLFAARREMRNESCEETQESGIERLVEMRGAD